METEENIVYQLLDTIRANELNNDEVIGERDIRALMLSHRAELINKYSKMGLVLDDVCFQKKTLTLTDIDASQYTSDVPAIIFLRDHFGTKLTAPNGANIPIMGEESYELGKSNPINKNKPKAKIENKKLTVYVGPLSEQYMGSGTFALNTINSIRNNEYLLLSAIFINPDDGTGYNWTTSEYPMPYELIQDMKKNILRREFNIILSTKSDQVPNMKNDTLRYHDQGKVQQ